MFLCAVCVHVEKLPFLALFLGYHLFFCMAVHRQAFFHFNLTKHTVKLKGYKFYFMRFLEINLIK